MEKSYREYFEFKFQATDYLKEKSETRFGYAVSKSLKRNYKIGESHTEQTHDIQIEHALVDDKSKKLIKDAKGNPEVNKEGAREIKEKTKALLEKKVEIVCPDKWPTVPDDLTIEEIEMFSGFVIDPEQVEELIESVLRKDDEKREKDKKK